MTSSFENLSSITSNQYGFKVFDWDNNRGNSEGAGPYLVGKVQISKNQVSQSRGIPNYKTDWKELSDQGKAEVCNQIFKEYKTKNIDGLNFESTSIHIRGSFDSEDPFLFILGNKV